MNSMSDEQKWRDSLAVGDLAIVRKHNGSDKLVTVEKAYKLYVVTSDGGSWNRKWGHRTGNNGWSSSSLEMPTEELIAKIRLHKIIDDTAGRLAQADLFGRNRRYTVENTAKACEMINAALDSLEFSDNNG